MQGMTVRSAIQAFWLRCGRLAQASSLRPAREVVVDAVVGAWVNGSGAVDQWLEEEQWLAGLPRHRTEQFGRLWWRYS